MRTMHVKRCSRCGEVKPLEEFSPDPRKRDGRYAHCRPCINDAARKRVAGRPKSAPPIKRTACVDCGESIAFSGPGRPPKRCPRCRREEKKRAGRETHRRTRLKRNAQIAQIKAEQRAKLAAIKAECGCADCGTRAEPLDFDHRPNEVKLFAVSAHLGGSWDRLMAEVAKCDVRCRSCHTRRHALAGDLAINA